MKIAYLINQYPKISHSFIRREIIQLETAGLKVERFSIRSCADELVDPTDQEELAKTRIILEVGIFKLLDSFLRVALSRPTCCLKALLLTIKIGYGSERGLVRHFAYLAEACILLFRLNDLGISHIHTHFGTNSTTVAMLCHLLGEFTYSCTIHGPEEFDKPLTIALPEKIKRASFVIAVSSFGKSQLSRWCPYQDWSKIHVVHCGLEQEFLSVSPMPIPAQPRFVCIGRLCEQKGQLLLIEAVAKLAAEGMRFKLVLVGDGELRPEIERLIEQFKLQDQIEITGWASSDEVKQQILAAKAMVLPSFAEGLPVVIMESLALGRPVLSTYVAGIPELVEPNVCGWLVPAGNIEALTQAMKQVLELPNEKLEQMGQLGAKKVAFQHNIVTEASKLADLFKKTLSK